MKKIVGPFQSAFFKGRAITDNYVVAHETLHSFKKKRKLKYMRPWSLIWLKLMMGWNRILQGAVLEAFGIHESFVQIIRVCISSVSFSILLNGYRFGNVIPSTGRRQRDPLSPYLYIFGAEVLSWMLIKVESEGFIHGVKVARNAPSISHLYFADDSFLFCSAKVKEAREIKDIMDDYCRLSG